MSEGTRSKTMEEILRGENASLKEQIKQLEQESKNQEHKLIDLMNEKAALKLKYDDICDRIEKHGQLTWEHKKEETKHRLEKEYLRGQVDAYKIIFANHNLSLYAKD